MANPIPIVLIGGAALFLVSGKKKKRKKTSEEAAPSDVVEEKDEDMDEKDEEIPIPSPAPEPAPTPIPKPIPIPVPVTPIPAEPDEPLGPIPAESSKPPLGPTGVGSCANQIYTRDPEYLTPDIIVSQKALTAFYEKDYYFYIRRDFQAKLYNYMFQRFTAMKNLQERRTVASVILRESLKNFNSGCKWELPIDSLGEPERLVWKGGHRLAVMGQITSGISDPSFDQLFKTGKRYTITRDSLGEPDPGFFGAQKKPALGTRVEILASDSTQENAEHIIGEITKMTGPNSEPDLFEVRIVDKFQNVDVAPRLWTKHGFKVGSNAFFSQKGPTGIYRMFKQGMI